MATKVARQVLHSRRSPQPSMPRMAPEVAKPAQTLTARPRCAAGKTAVIVDSVPGMIIAAPMPMTTRHAMSARRRLGSRRAERGEAEDDGADEQQRPPAEPVAERAEGQHEGGEGDGVAVGDPGELRARRAEVEADAGQRQVDARDRRDDQHEGEAHRGEGPPSFAIEHGGCGLVTIHG